MIARFGKYDKRVLWKCWKHWCLGTFLIDSSVVDSWYLIVNVINMSHFENYKDIKGNEDILLRI